MRHAIPMRRARCAAAAAAALLAAFIALPAAAAEGCEGRESLRLVNGKIHTMDAQDSVVSTVVIDGGRFAAVGPGATQGAGPCTTTINLGGRTVVPGIIDNHNHIILLGLRPGHDTRLENARSIAEVLGTLAARTRDVPAGEWITSLGGFNINQFTPPPDAPRFPTLAELDGVTPNHPVFILQSFSGPSVTNSLGKAFFESKGVTVADNGMIAPGTQSVRALNALRAIQTFEEQKRGLGIAMTYAAEVGVTTHLDQGGFPNVGNPDTDALANFDRFRAFDSLRALNLEGKLTNRIWINFLHLEEDPQTPELQARLLNAFNNFGGNMMKVLGIGEFTAGPFIFPGSPAWLHGTRLVAAARWRNENHSLNITIGGIPDWQAVIDGWQAVHDEMVAAGSPEGIKDLRWVLAHVPVISTEYLQRLKNLGGGVSVLGGWRYISGTPSANGPPFRRILESGIRTGMSSDGMQISPMNPWLGMYYAVTGKNARGVLINDGQQISRQEVLKLYTADNAWFLREDGNIGSIEEGRWADLIVLNKDYFDPAQVSDEGIRDIFSVLTIVNGKIVHDNLDGTKPMYWSREYRQSIGLQ